MTRSIIHLTNTPHTAAAGDHITVEYAYVNPAAVPVVPPWWEGNPSLGCSNGYPISTDLGRDTYSNASGLSVSYLDALVTQTFGDLTGYFQTTLVLKITLPPVPAGWGVTVGGNDYVAQGWREFSVALIDGRPGSENGNGVQLPVKLVSITGSPEADRMAWIDAVSVEVIGLQAWTYFTGSQSLKLPQDDPNGFLGVTDGGKCRFWMGRKVATMLPADATPAATTDPYYSLPTSL